MSRPLVRDANPAMRRLMDFVDDQDNDRPVHVMALALRAALSECAQEQSVAVAGLEEKPDPEASQAERDAEQRFRWDSLGRLYMANKVVRRIAQLVERLGQTPAQAEPIEDRAEVRDVLVGRVMDEYLEQGSARGLTETVDALLDALVTAGYAIVRDPAVCGDYPAPCNCDDPLIHNGR